MGGACFGICLSFTGVNFGGDELIILDKSPLMSGGGGPFIGPFVINGIGGGGGGGGACTTGVDCLGGDTCFGIGGGGGNS